MTALTQKSFNDIPYWEMQIGSVQPDTPIVLALHYMGGDAAAMHFVHNDFPKPLRVLSLQGQYPSDLPEEGYSWYPDGDAFYDRSEADQASDIRRVADRIAVFLAHIRSQYTAKIAVMGMSQGGDLSLSLAVYHPQLIDVAIPCAGRLSSPMRPDAVEKPASGLPRVYMEQGVEDKIVSVESAREVAAWLRSVGYTADLQEYPHAGHEIPLDMVKDMQQVLAKL